MMNTTRLELGRDNCGNPMIGATEFDENGMGVRAYCISLCNVNFSDETMQRRFEDLKNLMGDNVSSIIESSWELKDYKETEIQRDHRGYFLAHVLVEDDGPDYYKAIQADSLEGIHSLIDEVR